MASNLSLCCGTYTHKYAGMQTCSTCGSSFSKKNELSLKPKSEQFEADFSPFEQYRYNLQTEKARMKLDEYLQGIEYPLPYLF